MSSRMQKRGYGTDDQFNPFLQEIQWSFNHTEPTCRCYPYCFPLILSVQSARRSSVPDLCRAPPCFHGVQEMGCSKQSSMPNRFKELYSSACRPPQARSLFRSVLTGAIPCFTKSLMFFASSLAGLYAGFGTDVRLRFYKVVLVSVSNDGNLKNNRGVSERDVFHLNGGDPDTLELEHVVATTAIGRNNRLYHDNTYRPC